MTGISNATLKPSMSTYWLIGGAVLATAVVLVAIGFFLLSSTPAPLAEAKAFITLIESDELEPAYSKYHDDLRDQQSFPEFVETWSNRSASLREANRFWSTDIKDDSAGVTGLFTTGGEQSWSARFRLIKQGETWQIVGVEIVDADSSASEPD